MFANETKDAKSPGLLTIAKTTISIAAVVASALFLVGAFRESWSELAKIASYEGIYGTVLLLSIAYACSYFLLAVAWHRMLRHISPTDIPFAKSAYVYCLANIAKYVPGSIFHFAGRQILGARAGLRQADIARATILELVANLVAVATIIVVASPLGLKLLPDDFISDSWQTATPTVWTAFIVLLAIGTAALFGFPGSRLVARVAGITGVTLWLVLTLNIIFFVSNFGMAMILAAFVGGQTDIPLVAFGLAYLMAWLAGFTIPGAPGGIGVREGVLVLLLAGHADGEAAGLALGIGMRAVTILGDIFSGATGYWLGRSASKKFRLWI